MSVDGLHVPMFFVGCRGGSFVFFCSVLLVGKNTNVPPNALIIFRL